jgi:hypothetical protein
MKTEDKKYFKAVLSAYESLEKKQENGTITMNELSAMNSLFERLEMYLNGN